MAGRSSRAVADRRPMRAELETPLEPLVIGLLMPEPEQLSKIAKREAEFERKLGLLMEQYGIDKRSRQKYRSLALALAVDFVVGFREGVKLGAPEKWSDYELGALVVEIERLKRSRGFTIKQAAAELSRAEPWKSGLSRWLDYRPGSDRAEALRHQYHKAKRSKWLRKVAQTMQDAFRYHESRGDIAGWEKALCEECFNPVGNKA